MDIIFELLKFAVTLGFGVFLGYKEGKLNGWIKGMEEGRQQVFYDIYKDSQASRLDDHKTRVQSYD